MAKIRQHKKKSTDAVVAERIRAVRSLVNQGQTKGAIKVFCCQNFGVHYRTAETYYARAREEMLADAGIDRETLLAESKAFWSEMLVNDDASLADRMRARENLDKLFALSQASMKVVHSGTVEHAASTKTLEAIADALLGSGEHE